MIRRRARAKPPGRDVIGYTEKKTASSRAAGTKMRSGTRRRGGRRPRGSRRTGFAAGSTRWTWTTRKASAGCASSMRKVDYGRIVNVASTMGSLTEMAEGYPAYRIVKAALNAVTRVLAYESM